MAKVLQLTAASMLLLAVYAGPLPLTITNFVAPFLVWVEGLLPLVGSKQYSALAAQCGRDMLSRMDSQCQAAVAATTAREGGAAGLEDKTAKRPVSSSTLDVFIWC